MQVPAPASDSPRTERDRCPGVLRLHDALDGALARVRLPGGRARSDQLAVLATGARLGSGVVEITSRANVQLRGLPHGARQSLAALLGDAGLLPSLAHERARNVAASPVAGRHPAAVAAVDDVVAALDRGLCADPALAALSGRFSFLVDDGSGLLPHHEHDVALIASKRAATPVAALALDGEDTGLRTPLGSAAELALAAARAFLAERAEGSAWRIREMPGGARRVAARMGTTLAPDVAGGRRTSGPPALPVPPRLRQRDGRVAVTALAPLGRLDPAQLERLAELARAHGTDARFSPWRTLTLVDVPSTAVDEVERELGGLGLVLDLDSGWHGLSACAGLGACARARADVRAAAAARAASRTADAPPEHWTACERRCGERGDVPVAVSSGPDGVEVRVGGEVGRVASTRAALRLLARAAGEEHRRRDRGLEAPAEVSSP